MTVATLQLGVGALYSFVIWIVGYNFLPCVGFVKPVKQSRPKMSIGDVIKMLPVAFCSAAAHSASVLALNAGSVTFGQIVMAAEPVFSAVIAIVIYGKPVSTPKLLCLPLIVGGVIFSSFKPDPTATGFFPYKVEVDVTVRRLWLLRANARPGRSANASARAHTGAVSARAPHPAAPHPDRPSLRVIPHGLVSGLVLTVAQELFTKHGYFRY